VHKNIESEALDTIFAVNNLKRFDQITPNSSCFQSCYQYADSTNLIRSTGKNLLDSNTVILTTKKAGLQQTLKDTQAS